MADPATDPITLDPNEVAPDGAQYDHGTQQQLITRLLQEKGVPMTAENLNRAAHFLYSGEWNDPAATASPAAQPAPAAGPAAPQPSAAPGNAPAPTARPTGAPAGPVGPAASPQTSTPNPATDPATADDETGGIPFIPPVVAARRNPQTGPVDNSTGRGPEPGTPPNRSSNVPAVVDGGGPVANVPPAGDDGRVVGVNVPDNSNAIEQENRPRLTPPYRDGGQPAPSGSPDAIAPGSPDEPPAARQLTPPAADAPSATPGNPTQPDPQLGNGVQVDAMTGDPLSMSIDGMPEGTRIVPNEQMAGRYSTVDIGGRQAYRNMDTGEISLHTGNGMLTFPANMGPPEVAAAFDQFLQTNASGNDLSKITSRIARGLR